MTNIVEVKGLTKSYGQVTAVDHVSFTIEANKIYGLLGRNGAGKTTIMHMISSQQFATSGELKVFGEEPYENSRVLNQICFIKESQKYPDSFRVIDVIEVARSLFPNWDHTYAHALIEDFRLPLKRKIKKLSRGMLSSVGIVVGLASRAPLTIFDEPYLGLDAVARILFYDRLLEDYAEFPRTVILSTHLIDEVSRLLEHVLVIDNGKLIMNEDADALRGRACTVSGLATAVDSFTRGKELLERTAIGAAATATLLGALSDRDRKEAEAMGLEFAPVSMQQLIVHLTRTSIRGKGTEE
ncbi:ABC transporter ATP-binding protein [Paenibacillus alginolyticus]|uniref:ABC transporter ATP-binding protein n=1 Tax=Paenibacillus alginolyticus TaxID=59839 RepID=A0ABT4G7C9_9BACL|nr:ABC transporter ATP-binding protein [Paenibacillus alginolyticus]MCY9692078.1 ABC transporter ATP-binding protein [Paenibacillus alginolyticus]MEC0147843.1 ABC transporter ATP-binding protein [Paenibacillus alginolyticus]